MMSQKRRGHCININRKQNFRNGRLVNRVKEDEIIKSKKCPQKHRRASMDTMQQRGRPAPGSG